MNFMDFTSLLYSNFPIFKKIIVFAIIADMKVMQGETLTEIAKALDIEKWAAEKRIRKAGIKPLTREAVYPIGTIETVRNAAPVGRPKKQKEA